MSFRLVCRSPTLQRSLAFCPARTLASSTRSAPRPAFFNAHRLTRIGLASGAIVAASLFYGHTQSTIHADAALANERANLSERPRTPLSTLIRTYVVYAMCSIPPLVDYSPAILAALLSIPGIKQITEAAVRITFFNQFVGGDTAEDTIPVMEQLRAENKGCIFVYSVEVDEEEAAGNVREDTKSAELAHKQIVTETIHCVDVAADFEDRYTSGVSGRRTWVAVKLSAMLPSSESLLNLSKHLVATRPLTSPRVAFPGCPLPADLDILDAQTPPGPLTPGDVAALRELRADLHAICSRAKQRGVRIVIDAEHSWYQPAIDALCLDLMREFNKLPQPPKKSQSLWFGSSPAPVVSPAVQPLIYNTYQAYLHRTPEYLTQSIAAAHAGGYALGVKLVRGAYHPHEVSSHTAAANPSSAEHSHSLSISPEALPPVWLTKPETDACFNSCAAQLVGLIRADVAAGAPSPTIGVMLGTHNWESTDLVLRELVRQGLAKEQGGVVHIPDEVTERISLGQLYGMHDALTNHLVDRTRCSSPFVLKYTPYGNLSDVMPYLSRRAIENKSVLGNGGAAVERQRAAKEIRERFFG
ncbi:Proline dehydrogenase 1, mitochondrial [Grifola frondosa]|uniref:Proline dehydrogenase n=1 Tax=Grifola frondosa TaxID=5627 RepID=A0A1C7MY90_GRIFR|nr:Proline dehydrogenase 1, mitochondrial [Grifola frondosa]